MSTRMKPEERARFDNQILFDENQGWLFQVWEEKHHKCCVVCVVSKGDYIAREYRFPTEMLANMIATWTKGIFWLEKELAESI